MAHAYPRRNVFKRVVERVRLEYYRYEVTIGVYCMTWGEKWIFNSFVVFVLLLLVWALFFYFPSLLFHKVKRLGWLLTGRDATHANNFSLTWSNGRAIPTPMVTEAPAYT